MVDLYIVNKIKELPKVLVLLTREPDDEGGSQDNARNVSANALKQATNSVATFLSSHSP